MLTILGQNRARPLLRSCFAARLLADRFGLALGGLTLSDLLRAEATAGTRSTSR